LVRWKKEIRGREMRGSPTDDEEHSSHDARHRGLPCPRLAHEHVVGEELRGVLAVLGALGKRLAQS